MQREVTIRVRLTPRTNENAVVRYEDGVAHVRVTAPPVDGAANAALIRLLSAKIGVAKSRIRIDSGTTSREKRVMVEGITRAELEAALGSLGGSRPSGAMD